MGFDTQEIMDTMPGLLDLAASANMDLGQAADIASNIISGFGLEAKEAGRVSDVLAASAANANTSVDQMGDAMSYVAPVAQGAGISLEETAGAIGVLSDSGIQGQRAGTALRKVISSLQNPTGQTAKVIEDMGISMDDVDPSAHSLSDILKVLEDAGMDSSQAMALVGEQAGPGLIALLEEGSGGLSEFTKDMENSEGAAADMADTMEDNAKGSMREFKSALEEAGISLSEHMLPAVTDMIEGGTELARKFGELDDSTQKNIIKFAGLAAAAGPAALVLGSMTTATGGVLRVGGKLSKSLGKAGGAGLLGRIGGLGKGGVVGLAIAGVAALGVGIYKLHQNSKEAKEVNLELAQSFSDQAVQLEESVTVFDSLSGKAKASNEQLAELNDLNEQISESSNPGEIQALQEQYDELARNSGLSKDELKDLFDANGDIIEQSPDVETSVSDQGNAFAKNTDKVNEYIASLRKQSELDLESERTKLLAQEEEIRGNINEKTKALEANEQRLKELNENAEMSKSEISDRVSEINDKIAAGNLSEEESFALDAERNDLLAIKKGKTAEILDDLQGERKEIQKSISGEEEKLEKLDAVNGQMANIYLQNVGINEEGDKGLTQLDESISKNQETINKLEEKKKKHGELSDEQQTNLDKAREEVKEQENARQKIFEKTGLYNDLNSLVDSQIKKSGEETQKIVESLGKTRDIKVEEGNILKQLDNKNKEHDKSIKKLKENGKQEGLNKKEIQEQIVELENKKGKNDDVKVQILKELGLWDDLDDNIKDTIQSTISQGGQIDSNNRKTQTGIEKEQERSAEAAREIFKDINVSTYPTVPQLNRDLMERVKKPVSVNPSTTPKDLNASLREDISKNVNLNAKPSGNNFTLPLLQYAKGTKGHPTNSPAMVGDGKGSNAGSEMITEPNGKQYLSPSKPTVVDMKKGTHVTPAKTTKKILNNIPAYADGVGNLAKISFKKLGALGLGGNLLGGSFGNPFAPVAKGAISKMTSMFTSGNLGLNLAGGTSSKKASSWAGDIRRAAGALGEVVTNSQVQGIIKQINRESGGNPNIVQSSAVRDINTMMGNPARGLLQYIPQTFGAYKAPGHGNIYSGYDQLMAFFNNKNWRKDLPYGTRGWGPTGGRKYSKGTDSHPGGPFLAGEKGWELGRMGNHWELLNAGVYDRPRGYEVYSHNESKKIMRAVNNVPGYANGTSGTRRKSNGAKNDNSTINQTVNIYSPDPTSPSENARKMKQASRRLAMEW